MNNCQEDDVPMIGVYVITCVPTGDRYVGYSRDVARRWEEHCRDLRKGRHKPAFQDVVDRYGLGSLRFDLIERFDASVSAVLIKRREDFWQDELKARLSQPINYSRIFWDWIKCKGGRGLTPYEASKLRSECRGEYLAYKESRLKEITEAY